MPWAAALARTQRTAALQSSTGAGNCTSGSRRYPMQAAAKPRAASAPAMGAKRVLSPLRQPPPCTTTMQGIFGDAGCFGR